MYFRKLFIALTLMVAACSYAWHEDKPPGAKFVPEISNQQLAQEQAAQKVQGEVGVVVRDRDVSSKIDPGMSDSIAEDVVAQDESAVGALKKAEEDRKPQAHAGTSFLWGAVALALAFGTVAFAKQWANRNIPEMAQVKRVRW